MRSFSFSFLLIAGLAFAGPALAHDAGIHCIQFGPDHTGCGGGGDPPTPPGSGGGGDVDIDNTNTNTNLNTAFGGAGGDGGSAIQGQQQGQIGIVSGGDVSTSTSTSTSTSQRQSNSNTAVGSGNDTKVRVDARDQSTTHYEAQKRNPVSSAAFVSATACSRGASAQSVGMGGSIAFTNELCDAALGMEIATKAAYDPNGNLIEGGFTASGVEIIPGEDFLIQRQELAMDAVKMARARNNPFRRFCQYVPFFGQFF